MYGFRPARNRKHPGDPPPKWAPLGRFGRLVLVVTVIVGVVIALLITATRTTGFAEATDGPVSVPERSPSPWIGGQRIEVPGAGLTVTFPEDWVVDFAEEGSDLPIMIIAQPDRFGPEVNLQRLLVAEGPNMRERDMFTLCSLDRYARSTSRRMSSCTRSSGSRTWSSSSRSARG